MSILSKRLIEERIRLNISKAEMAKRLNITRPAYLYYESGKTEPPIQKLAILAEIFGVSADYLLGKTDKRNTILSAPTPQNRETAQGLLSIICDGDEEMMRLLNQATLSADREINIDGLDESSKTMLRPLLQALVATLKNAKKTGATEIKLDVPVGGK